MHARKSHDMNVTASAHDGETCDPHRPSFTATMVVDPARLASWPPAAATKASRRPALTPPAPDLTGYWVFAGETDVAPEAMIRVTADDDGYLRGALVLAGDPLVEGVKGR